MKKFDFKNHLIGRDLEYLQHLRSSLLEDLVEFISCGHKDSSKISKYITYVDIAISKTK